MSYVKTAWKKGDVITAEKLNNLETGVESAGPLVVHVSMDMDTGSSIMDHTYAQILSALMSGRLIPVIYNGIPELHVPDSFVGYVIKAYPANDVFNVSVTESFASIDESNIAPTLTLYQAATEDDYPVFGIE